MLTIVAHQGCTNRFAGGALFGLVLHTRLTGLTGAPPAGHAIVRRRRGCDPCAALAEACGWAGGRRLAPRVGSRILTLIKPEECRRELHNAIEELPDAESADRTRRIAVTDFAR